MDSNDVLSISSRSIVLTESPCPTISGSALATSRRVGPGGSGVRLALEDDWAPRLDAAGLGEGRSVRPGCRGRPPCPGRRGLPVLHSFVADDQAGQYLGDRRGPDAPEDRRLAHRRPRRDRSVPPLRRSSLSPKPCSNGPTGARGSWSLGAWLQSLGISYRLGEPQPVDPPPREAPAPGTVPAALRARSPLLAAPPDRPSGRLRPAAGLCRRYIVPSCDRCRRMS